MSLLYAITYMLLPYVFVVLILYIWNVESPPERVKDTVNNSIAVKGLKDDNAHKSNSHTVSRTHTEHRKTD